MERTLAVETDASRNHELELEISAMTDPLPIRHVIYRDGLTSLAQPDIIRHAIRGVVVDAPNILMVFSPVNGDFKFPGGGVEVGETHIETLEREIIEECGYRVSRIGPKVAEITEYGNSAEPDIDVFQMVSHYYLCSVDVEAEHEQELDGYEEALGFVPKWVTVSEALHHNAAIIQGTRPTPRWTPRETWFLEVLSRIDLPQP